MSKRIKSLESQLKSLRREANELRKLATEANLKVTNKNKEIEKTERDLKNLKNSSSLSVSDHALLRYIERAYGINVPELSREISEHPNMKLISVLGECKVPIDHGCRAIVKNNTVVTIIGGKELH